MTKGLEFKPDEFSATPSAPVRNILDIKVYQNPETHDIFIGFDLITRSFESSERLPLNIGKMQNSQHNYQLCYFYKNLVKLSPEEKTFLRSKCYQSTVLDLKTDSLYAKSSVIYQLPNNPNAAIYWLGAFSLYFCTVHDLALHVHLKAYTNKESFEQGIAHVDDIQTYATVNRLSTPNIVFDALVRMLLSFKKASRKASDVALQAVEAIFNEYHRHNSGNIHIDFIYFASPTIIFSILNRDKIEKLDEIKRFIHNDQPQALRTILEGEHQLAMMKLFSPAKGKRAHDRMFYNFHYTEFYFLRDAVFSKTKDDRLQITSAAIANNTSYQTIYAPGQINHNLFEPELLFLARILGLSLETTDFRQNGIIFSAESSKKLLDAGVFCIEERMQSVKKEVYRQSFWTFFSNCKSNKPSQDDSLDLLSLPLELLDKIQEQLEEGRPRPL